MDDVTIITAGLVLYILIGLRFAYKFLSYHVGAGVSRVTFFELVDYSIGAAFVAVFWFLVVLWKIVAGEWA
jgi:hypothetical protein